MDNGRNYIIRASFKLALVLFYLMAPFISSGINNSTNSGHQYIISTSKPLEDGLISYLSDKPKESILVKSIPVAMGAIIGAIIPAFFGWRTAKVNAEKELNLESIRATKEKDLESLKASLETAGKVVDIHQDQLRFFYGPMLALMQQSHGVVDKLTFQIYTLWEAKAWPSVDDYDNRQYKFATQNDNGELTFVTFDDTRPSDARLFIQTDEETWIRFRMLDFMPWLTKHPETQSLTTRIIKIGNNKVELISKHAGLAYTQENPTELYGEYLAHFAVLKAVYENPPSHATSPEAQKIGYYSPNLDAHIISEYLTAKDKVSKYERLTTELYDRMLNNHPVS